MSAANSILQNRFLRDQPQDDSYQHCSLYYCIIKQLGQGDNGQAYAAISKDAARLAIMKHERKQTQAFFDELRANLVAIKFAKPDNLEGDLTNEIIILTRELTEANPCYTWACNSTSDGPRRQWLALPFCNGGELGHFVHRYPGAVNPGFQWHVLCELVRGVLYIFWGIDRPNQTAPQVGWPLLTHSDIYTCNLLLSTRSPSFGDYPSVVIADFGRAEAEEPINPGSTSVSVSDDNFNNDVRGSIYLKELTEDIRCIGGVVDDIQADVAESGVQSGVPTAFQVNNMIELVLAQLRVFRARSIVQSIGFLHAVLEIAIEQRAATYQPMPADAVAFLNAPKVSDRELLASMC
ncbi:hypothetical protein Tdes44962_MAKER09388 [Teratosphaeria destructans]|uniref:Protein kinase domain-containing protein n=1 Tax=Teratosphaeria destructans TaxID=418781 RepID=A0A9W7STH0_9PEZI|nr:hypothetical protein Tdes44962_MAKER09388 [Teratosphaeria destructans]